VLDPFCALQAAVPGESLGRAFMASTGFDNPGWWRAASVGVLVAFIVGLNLVAILAFKYLDGAPGAPCCASLVLLHLSCNPQEGAVRPHTAEVASYSSRSCVTRCSDPAEDNPEIYQQHILQNPASRRRSSRRSGWSSRKQTAMCLLPAAAPPPSRRVLQCPTCNSLRFCGQLVRVSQDRPESTAGSPDACARVSAPPRCGCACFQGA